MVGARITLQLDEQGRAMKVMDTSLPDVMVMPTMAPAGLTGFQPLAATLDSVSTQARSLPIDSPTGRMDVSIRPGRLLLIPFNHSF